MRRMTWLLLAATVLLALLGVTAYAQDQSTMGGASQSTTTVQQSTTTTTTTAAPPAVAPGTTVVAPGAVAVVPFPAGVTAYNPAVEVTLTGVVTSAPMLAAPTDTDFQMMIQTPDGVSHRVWLAPQPFLRRQRFSPGVNDQVTVIGMPVGTTGDIIARQITWSNNTYSFRNAQGAPMWGYGAGRHRGYGRMRGGGFGRYSSLYNPHQVRTITGRVDRIDNVYPGGEAMGPGVAIRVQLSGMEPDMVPSWQLPPGDLQPTYVWVHLGPSWYVQQQFPDLHTGEIVTVTGSPALWRGEYVLLANSVQLGSQVVVFRNPAGLPLWAGGWQNWGGSPVIGALPAYPGYAVVPVYPGYAAAPTSALMTINGTIQNVQNVPAMGGFGAGTVLNILTPQNNVISVAVFPSSFASQMGVQFLPGQPVTIYGTMAMVNGQQMLVANQIDYNGERFALSNVNGVYTWGTVPMTAALPSGGPLSPPAAPMGSGY